MLNTMDLRNSGHPEAADEIVKLRREIERLRAMLDEFLAPTTHDSTLDARLKALRAAYQQNGVTK